MEQEIADGRQARPHRQRQPLPGRRPRPGQQQRDANQAQPDQHRPHQQRLAEQQVAEIAQPVAVDALNHRALPLKAERGPVALGVPPDHRREHHERQQRPCPHLPEKRPSTPLPAGQDQQQQAERQEGEGIFAPQPQPREHPRREPPIGVARVHEFGNGPERCRPAQHRRRIGGHQEADAGERGDAEPDHGERRGAPVEQQHPGAVSRRRHAYFAGDRHRPDTQFIGAEQRLTERNQPGDGRRMVEIADRQPLRPERIIALVEDEAAMGANRQLDGAGGEHHDNHRREAEPDGRWCGGVGEGHRGGSYTAV